MTISEMHTAVKLGLDKSSALDIPAFEPEEIDFWLNQAIRDFVKTRYSGVNLKKESFEQTQKRIDDLYTLVKEAVNNASGNGLDLVADAATVFPNSYIINTALSTWPTDYMFTISEEVGTATVSGSVSVNRWGITQCTHDKYRQKIDDPYSEHILHYGSAKPLRLFDDGYVRFITDGNYTLSKYYLTYLREPVEVYSNTPAATPTTMDCDLPEHTHDEIVRLAVNIMLENIEQPRLKTHSEFVATME